jgi:hypothetical protein
MPLSGEAKKAYQREYMREYMKNKRANVKTRPLRPVKTQVLRPDVLDQEKQENLRKLRELMNNPVRPEEEKPVSYDEILRQGKRNTPGARVLNRQTGEIFIAPETDLDGNTIPEYW